MPLETIYVVRHGFRTSWLVDPLTGTYSSSIKTPTGGPADPALTAHGCDQARELGDRLLAVDPPIERVYSSLYYRCLQTIEPFVRKAEATPGASTPRDAAVTTTAAASVGGTLRVRGETGIGEWYGAANFEHPVPATPDVLESHFPALLDHSYKPAVVPTRMGEGVDLLHDRVASTMEALIAECDRDGIRTIILCSHAAVVIALGRVLTGNMPESIETEDFKAFTCGLSLYRRRQGGLASYTKDQGAAAVEKVDSRGGTVGSAVNGAASADTNIRCAEWRGGRGVSGGWDCLLNSDCSFLSAGEERGWRFSGDESFNSAAGERSILGAGSVADGADRSETQKLDSRDGSGPKNAAGGSRL
ncbi:histidine phosphatase superfamily [Cercophora newfieldiana]|uniref:Histidine phosphatase superfamily n=1 Tax=Cercophora newfieldiana TaxID=92897 RepID=A0AA40CR84_9PEZI|nr:histidine phosphatase superfamily [Cercophora newfieldiana]